MTTLDHADAPRRPLKRPTAVHDPWARAPLVIAYDYGKTLAPSGAPSSRDGIARDQPLWPDAITVLRWLWQAHGIPAILSSNAAPSEPRRPALAAAGISDCFIACLISHERPFAKPDGRWYVDVLAAARRRYPNCQPSDVVHVGDSLKHDVIGPRRAGMRAVWISPRTHPRPAGARVRIIPGIAQLPTALGLRP
jgi:FMN phosphatase YigB (HAD superfamily)